MISLKDRYTYKFLYAAFEMETCIFFLISFIFNNNCYFFIKVSKFPYPVFQYLIFENDRIKDLIIRHKSSC